LQRPLVSPAAHLGLGQAQPAGAAGGGVPGAAASRLAVGDRLVDPPGALELDAPVVRLREGIAMSAGRPDLPAADCI